MKFILSTFLCLLSLKSYSQNTTILWDKTFGFYNQFGGGSVYFSQILKDNFGFTYLIGDAQTSIIGGDKSELGYGGNDVWIIKIDPNGIKIWDKVYGGSGYDRMVSTSISKDGGLLIACESYSSISGIKTEQNNGGSDFWIMKIDLNGDLIWEKTLGGQNDDYPNQIYETKIGNILISGTSGSSSFGDKTEPSYGSDDFWVVKLNSTGNLIWEKTYGGTDSDYDPIITEIENGECIIAGISYSNIGGLKSENSKGESDYWVLKINGTNGDIISDFTLGGDFDDFPASITNSDDYAVVITGESWSNASGNKTEPSLGSSDIWIMKIAYDGTILWDKTIGGVQEDYYPVIRNSIDNSFIISCESSSNISNFKSENSFGEKDFWIIKISEDGELIWDKTLGGSGMDTRPYLVTSDNYEFLVCGISNSNISGTKTTSKKGANDFWVLNLKDNIPFNRTAKIESMSELINRSAYEVPKEATVHHYFLLKDNNNKKLKGVSVIYQYGPFLHQSIPTDTSGLIDLNIMVGGSNPNISDDDWSPIGTQTVTFHSLLVGNVTGSNAFNPFDINVIDKALVDPADKESGFSFGVKFDATSTPDPKDTDIGSGVKVKLNEFSASAGISVGPTVTWREISPTLWEITAGGEIGAYGRLGFKNEIGYKTAKAGVPDISAGGEITPSFGFKLHLDLNNADQCYMFAKNIFESVATSNENYKKVSSFFQNVLNYRNITNPFTSNGAYAGVSIGLNASASLGVDVGMSIFNFKGYGKELEVGGKAEVSVEGDLLYELRHESEFSSSRISFSNSFTRGSSVNSSLGIAANLTKKRPVNIFSLDNLPLFTYSSSKQNTFKMKNNFDLNNEPTGTTISLSTMTDKSDWGLAFGPAYRVNYINNWEYNRTAMEKVYIAFYNNQNNINQNKIAQFAINNKLINPIGFAYNYPDNRSYMTNLFQFNRFITENAASNWTTNEINLNQKREITYINELTIPIEIPAIKLGELSYKSWRTYPHDYKKSYYSPSLKRVLPTIELPDILHNLEVPTNDPLSVFFDNLVGHVNALSTQIKQQAYSFLKEQYYATVDALLILSNAITSENGLSIVRKQLNGQILYNEFQKPGTMSSNSPSVFTFTINPSPQVFTPNTSIDFSYFYPENSVFAITQNDTFRIVTDVFNLKATLENANVLEAPNGSFSVSTQFSPQDLLLASLPPDLTPNVVFRPFGSSQWEEIGPVNQTFLFNRLGTFAIAVKLSNDKIKPTISVVLPSSLTPPNKILVTVSDNQSGIEWSNINFTANGGTIIWSRQGTTNTFEVLISSLPTDSEGSFNLQIRVNDLAGNVNLWQSTIPCAKSIYLDNSSRLDGTIVRFKAVSDVNSKSKVPENTKLEYKAGKNIILEPGFETKGSYFKADIGGCEN